MNRRMGRLQQEVLALALHYGEVDFDDDEGTWVVVRHFPLPAFLRRAHSGLLFKLDVAYPEIPPYGAYLDRGLRLHAYYHDDTSDLAAMGWAWFCCHFENGWRAKPDVWSGDNLMTAAAALSAALTALGRGA